MRAVFSVNIPPKPDGSFPSNEEFLSIIQAYGWEDRKLREMPNSEKEKRFRELAQQLLPDMPEISREEFEYLIFSGILQDNQTKFIITRVVDSQVTFRLHHPSLDRLTASVNAIITRLLKQQNDKQPFEISNQRVSIYERGFDEIIIVGRVIPNALQETWRIDKRNILLVLIALILLVPVGISLTVLPSSANVLILLGTLERLTTALLVTAIIGAIGFIQTYFEIKSHKFIDWGISRQNILESNRY